MRMNALHALNAVKVGIFSRRVCVLFYSKGSQRLFQHLGTFLQAITIFVPRVVKIMHPIFSPLVCIILSSPNIVSSSPCISSSTLIPKSFANCCKSERKTDKKLNERFCCTGSCELVQIWAQKWHNVQTWVYLGCLSLSLLFYSDAIYQSNTRETKPL